MYLQDIKYKHKFYIFESKFINEYILFKKNYNFCVNVNLTRKTEDKVKTFLGYSYDLISKYHFITDFNNS